MVACFLKLTQHFMICEKSCNVLEKHNIKIAAGLPAALGQPLVSHFFYSDPLATIPSILTESRERRRRQ